MPLGPVGQSTAGLLGGALDFLVYPGRDGTASLYEDDGLTYLYEQGAAARISIEWKQAKGALMLSPQRGSFPAMSKSRSIRADLMRLCQTKRTGSASP